MNKINYLPLLLTAISASVLNALSSEIENFDSYNSTSELQADVFSFGSAAQAGRPTLSDENGANGTNAAKFKLTWETGDNANLVFYNVSAVSGDLSNYEKIEMTFFMETADSYIAPSEVTLVKLAVEGGSNNTIWQTRSIKAVQLASDVFTIAIFELTEVDMERVSGSESFADVLANTGNIRLRFENTQQAGVLENAYIDSIEAIKELPKSGTTIQLGQLRIRIKNDSKEI
jgi:hypothetical protein